MKDIYETKPTGIVKIKVIDKNGNIVKEEEDNNLILIEASDIIAHALGGDVTNNQIDNFAIGNDNTAPDGADTTIGGYDPDLYTIDVVYLTSAFMSAVDTITYPSAGQVQFFCVIDYAEANTITGAINEIGLITPLTDTRLFARKVFGDVTKTSSLKLEFTWILQF